LKSLKNKKYPRVMRMPIAVLTLTLAALCKTAFIRAAAQETPPSATPVRTPLETALEDLASSTASVRRQGIYALGNLRDPGAVVKLIETLKDPDSFVRASAVDVLGSLRATQAAEAIAKLLQTDPEAQVRQQAAVSLSFAWSDAAAKPLLEALDDESPGVRYAATRTLGAARVQAAVKRLNALLSEDPDPAMRRTASGALQQFRDPSSLEPFINALKDSDALVRREAAKALAYHANDASIAALRGALKDSDPFVPLQAIESLARLGAAGPEEEALLLEKLENKDVRIRSVSANALGRIASKNSLTAVKKAAETEKHEGVLRSLKFAIDRIEAMEKRKK